MHNLLLLLACLITVALGQSYTTIWGTNNYIEYRLPANPPPIILTVPHGGTLQPAGMPNRTIDPLVSDFNTIELATKLAQQIFNLTGQYPPMVICHLRRNKLDANRDLDEAAQGNLQAGTAWTEYHSFIENATATVSSVWNYGHLFDIHGHGHTNTWVEVGLNINRTNLNLPDSILNSLQFIDRSSIRTLALEYGVGNFSSLVRGNMSIGGLLNSKGYPAVPGPQNSGPGASDYFDGGYTVERHGSSTGGGIDATQIETHLVYRNVTSTRNIYATRLSEVIVEFMTHWYSYNHQAVPSPSVSPYPISASPTATPSVTPSPSTTPSITPSVTPQPDYCSQSIVKRRPYCPASASSSPSGWSTMKRADTRIENQSSFPPQVHIAGIVGGVALVGFLVGAVIYQRRKNSQPSVEALMS